MLVSFKSFTDSIMGWLRCSYNRVRLISKYPRAQLSLQTELVYDCIDNI